MCLTGLILGNGLSRYLIPCDLVLFFFLKVFSENISAKSSLALCMQPDYSVLIRVRKVSN
jgi:hypothetical protein